MTKWFRRIFSQIGSLNRLDKDALERKSPLDTLMISISGIRGIVGESLTPEVITRFALAFGTLVKGGKVVVGRDTRQSGLMIKHGVFMGLISTGCQVVDLDICTAPSCSMMVQELGASGAVMITGSHNPIEWNALKFMNSRGDILNETEGRELLDLYYGGDFAKASWNSLVPVREDYSTAEKHIARVLAVTDADKIRKANIKVVLDSCNGAGSVITPMLLARMGCEVVKIHCVPDGLFPHNPEPLFVNLGDLCTKVQLEQADVGFAQDADADRLAIVDEKGHYLGEEYTLALAADYALARRPGPMAINMSTSRANEEIAARYGCPIYRTKVGEANVAEKMRQSACVIGGEGNGGVIDPRIHYVRDSLAAIALALSALAEEGKPLSRIVSHLPQYHMVKLKVECHRDLAARLIEKVRQAHPDGRADTLDGLRIDWDDSWVHVRPSNTEPAVRVIAEAKTKKKAQAIAKGIVEMAEDMIKSQ